ncbi:MAG: hypothetical protein ACRDPD_11225 [Streptosporangiaceae bacterium]
MSQSNLDVLAEVADGQFAHAVRQWAGTVPGRRFQEVGKLTDPAGVEDYLSRMRQLGLDG